MHFDFEQLKLPPPPPPPNANQLNQNLTPVKGNISKKLGTSPRKMQDNVESIDMDLSDDETTTLENVIPLDNMRVIIGPNGERRTLEPPPPLPELPEDVDANNFLDDLSNDLNSSEFTANLSDDSQGVPVFRKIQCGSHPQTWEIYLRI